MRVCCCCIVSKSIVRPSLSKLLAKRCMSLEQSSSQSKPSKCASTKHVCLFLFLFLYPNPRLKGHISPICLLKHLTAHVVCKCLVSDSLPGHSLSKLLEKRYMCMGPISSPFRSVKPSTWQTMSVPSLSFSLILKSESTKIAYVSTKTDRAHPHVLRLLCTVIKIPIFSEPIYFPPRFLKLHVCLSLCTLKTRSTNNPSLSTKMSRLRLYVPLLLCLKFKMTS